jgi:predicted anti-sigma-YlaC factor YlaD
MEKPMDCNKIEQLLPFLHDGSLERAVEREVERHLERCAGCSGAYAELSAIVNLTRNVLRGRRIQAGPGYIGEIRERIRKRMHARSLYRWAVPAAAAAFLAVSVGTYSLFLGGVNYRGDQTYTVRTAPSSSSNGHTATVDEKTLINALYHYTGVTLDDIVSRMDENELAAALDGDEK